MSSTIKEEYTINKVNYLNDNFFTHKKQFKDKFLKFQPFRINNNLKLTITFKSDDSLFGINKFYNEEEFNEDNFLFSLCAYIEELLDEYYYPFLNKDSDEYLIKKKLMLFMNSGFFNIIITDKDKKYKDYNLNSLYRKAVDLHTHLRYKNAVECSFMNKLKFYSTKLDYNNLFNYKSDSFTFKQYLKDNTKNIENE